MSVDNAIYHHLDICIPLTKALPGDDGDVFCSLMSSAGGLLPLVITVISIPGSLGVGVKMPGEVESP